MAKKRGRPKKLTPVEEVVENKAEEVTEDTMDVDKEFSEDTPKEEVTPEVADNVEDIPSIDMPFNPLADAVQEKDYATPKIEEGIISEIDEPSFEPPSFEEQEAEAEANQPSAFDNLNPAVNDLEPKDKKIACESMVDAVLDGYDSLHIIAQKYVKVSDEDLLAKQVEGKLNLQKQIPVSEDGSSMSVQEFIDNYNEQSIEALTPDPEFREKVKPAMTRVFMKHGWGMTDEQYLAYMFGKDLVTKASIVYGLKKTINTTLSMLEKAHQRSNAPITVESETVEKPKRPKSKKAEETFGTEKHTIDFERKGNDREIPNAVVKEG